MCRGAPRDSSRTVIWRRLISSGLTMKISMNRPDLQFSSKTVMSTIAQPVVVTDSRLRNFSECLEDTRVLEYLCGCQSEVTKCTAFGDGDWAWDVESCWSTTGCWKSSHTTASRASHAPRRVIALSSGEAEVYALQRAAAGALQKQHSIGRFGTASASDGAMRLRHHQAQGNCGISG